MTKAARFLSYVLILGALLALQVHHHNPNTHSDAKDHQCVVCKVIPLNLYPQGDLDRPTVIEYERLKVTVQPEDIIRLSFHHSSAPLPSCDIVPLR